MNHLSAASSAERGFTRLSIIFRRMSLSSALYISKCAIDRGGKGRGGRGGAGEGKLRGRITHIYIDKLLAFDFAVRKYVPVYSPEAEILTITNTLEGYDSNNGRTARRAITQANSGN